jgi:hypothetical protein
VTDDLAAVRAKVAAAKRIVLYIHGIIGETRGMAASSRSQVPTEGLIVKSRIHFTSPAGVVAPESKSSLLSSKSSSLAATLHLKAAAFFLAPCS